MSLWLAILVFLVSAAVLVRAGSSLAGYADQIADRTKMSRLFVGTLLLAFATSLPELITEVTAARAGAPDLALGDLFGSSMANMAILACIDLLYRGRVWPSVELGHARVAAVAIALTAMVALSIFPKVFVQKPTGWSAKAAERSTRSLWARFAGAALVILITAPVVTLSVKVIADSTGIAQTFLGAALLAVTTSLPELIASIASVRIGAYDMAVGNLFGSNVANMSVLLFADIAYTKGPILAAVSQSQIVAGIGAILLMAIAVAAIVGESERTRFRRFEPDAIVLLVAYAATLTAIAYYG
jgi:cation:H+ antiporter